MPNVDFSIRKVLSSGQSQKPPGICVCNSRSFAWAMHMWVAALVLAALQLCSGVTHDSSAAQQVTIGAHGHVIAAGHGHDSTSSGLLQADFEQAGVRLMRQEHESVGHELHRATLHERRSWAKRHGNVFTTHRLLQKIAAGGLPTWRNQWIIVPIIGAFLACGCGLTIFQFILAMWRGSSARELSVDEMDAGSSLVEKMIVKSPVGLDEDIYGMGIAALIRDTQRFAMGTEVFALRLSRLLLSLSTLIFCLTLQVFLLFEMKVLVTSASTVAAQGDYNAYEILMYGNDTANMTDIGGGNLRGKPENFNQHLFDSLGDDEKSAICQIPLSQPSFFIGILVVWTLVCMSEIRHSFDIAGSLLVSTPTISDMKDSLEETEQKGDEAVIVIGLTMTVKILAAVFIIIPRLLVSGILLWLGCRWLTGTFGFSDVLQNAVALEFILMLKDIFYDTITPGHNKTETRNTKIKPFTENERPSTMVFLGSFTWGVLAIVWVVGYVVSFQQVLPDYQWDVHLPCVRYLSSIEEATP